MEEKGVDFIPVLRPQLPHAEDIIPYLRRIDSTRIYSNWGPLCGEFQNRISRLFGIGENNFVAASSGTAALIGAILAEAGPATPMRPLAIIPGFTFPATAIAAERCGYVPRFIDVSFKNWMLEPDGLADYPSLDRVGIVIPVSPFGNPIEQDPWISFHQRTGISVVIDGASSFDRIAARTTHALGPVPVAISLHATKSFGIGEGGGVICEDTNCAVPHPKIDIR